MHLNTILNNVLLKKKSNIHIYFTKTLCVYLYANGFLTLSFLQKKQIYLRVLSVFFYNKKFVCKKKNFVFSIILSVCNILIKQNFFFVCYLYNVFFLLFKRIVYLLSYTNFFTFSFVKSYSCFKRVFKEECLKYHIYYKNIYLKKKNYIMYNTNTTSKNIFQLVKSNNLNICFLQYNTASRLYKKLRYRSLKKRNIKNKKKKFYTNKKNIYIVKKNNKRRHVNKFLKFKCVNLKKKKSSIYLKTLRKCFNFKIAVLKSIIQKKNKLLIKKKIKKKTHKQTRVVLKTKSKKANQKVKKKIKSKKKNKNLSNNNNNDFNKKK